MHVTVKYVRMTGREDNSLIQVENLVKRYGSHTAVDHLTFHVKKGQIYGFLGSNGAGKSTTMNIMTGYLAATEGSVRINGYDILTQPEEAKKSIGYLPEFPPLYQEMTVYEYLKFAAELKKLPKTERKKLITEAMEMTKTEEAGSRLIRNLSKGYKQRVGLAQAILGYPEVIILDEPTVGLDPKQIIEIRDLIRRLGEKHTVILSSHILSEVSAVCDHIMIISEGRLVASDSAKALQRRMSGTAELKIAVLGTQAEVTEALRDVTGQEGVRISCSEAADILHVSIEAEAGKDMSREVGIALAQYRLPVLSMYREEKTLEDIFLRLTSVEQKEFKSEEPGEKEEEDESNS